MKLEDLDLNHIAQLLHITEKCRLHPNLKPIHDVCLNRLHEIANPPLVVEERRVPRYDMTKEEEFRRSPSDYIPPDVRREKVDEALRHKDDPYAVPSSPRPGPVAPPPNTPNRRV